MLRLSHCELRVRDVEASAEFYHDLFGLARVPNGLRGDEVRLHLLTSDGALGESVITLSRGMTYGAELLGVDHIGLQAPTARDVDRIYAKAQALRARATRPRLYDGQWQTFVFDPDGYKIEVCCPLDERFPRLPGETEPQCAGAEARERSPDERVAWENH
jgi:catechol 2,3-dioxygenase-like lactoylglutathione lyase family enzyme